ncbi:hypothetical protein LPU83_pLPU83c_0520 (plasmid) [Rhizobium favelukesii]|uniref:Uncharacterized protein n=1 Tax=Rhizobium favelukesii TaxID=348824 RepID=W6RIV4_9HYPH|nr:hypothetical protein LPU83_pLPU83c_0520 [Rhizobium favelukesii]
MKDPLGRKTCRVLRKVPPFPMLPSGRTNKTGLGCGDQSGNFSWVILTNLKVRPGVRTSPEENS